MPNADVFISYRRDQRDQVLVIAQRLEELGLSVWFDARLEAGTSFDEEINREVRSAKAVFVCWSAAAVQSRWVRAEASIGLERDVLVAAYLEPAELMPPYNLVHAANLQGWSGAQDAPVWTDILGRIGRLVGKPELPERARVKALDAQWAARDQTARAEFAQKQAEAQRRFAALQESRPAAFAQEMATLAHAFEDWLLTRRAGGADGAPDPLELVEDQAVALRAELEIVRRERDAAAAKAQAATTALAEQKRRLQTAEKQAPASPARQGDESSVNVTMLAMGAAMIAMIIAIILVFMRLPTNPPAEEAATAETTTPEAAPAEAPAVDAAAPATADWYGGVATETTAAPAEAAPTPH